MTKWQAWIVFIKQVSCRISNGLRIIIGRFKRRALVNASVSLESHQINRALQNWLHSAVGTRLEAQQLAWLQVILSRFFGYYAVQYGVSCQQNLLQASVIKHHVRLSPIVDHSMLHNVIRADAAWWPIVPNSIDLVLLQHILEIAEHPQQVLREAACSVRAGGRLVIIGFNPYSLLQLLRLCPSHPLHSLRFLSVARLKDWLKLLSFRIEQVYFDGYLASLPPNNPLGIVLSKWCRRWHIPISSFYCIVAVHEVPKMTPIQKVAFQRREQYIRQSLFGSVVNQEYSMCDDLSHLPSPSKHRPIGR